MPGVGVRDSSKTSETTPVKNSEESEKNMNNNPTCEEKVSVMTCPEESKKKDANKDSPVVNQDEELREPGPLLPPPGLIVSQPQTKLRTIVIDGSNVCCLKKVRRHFVLNGTVLPDYFYF